MSIAVATSSRRVIYFDDMTLDDLVEKMSSLVLLRGGYQWGDDPKHEIVVNTRAISEAWERT